MVLDCFDLVLAGWYLQFCPSLEDWGGGKGEARVIVTGWNGEEGGKSCYLAGTDKEGGAGWGLGGWRRDITQSPVQRVVGWLVPPGWQPVTPPAETERRWRVWIWDEGKRGGRGRIAFERLRVFGPSQPFGS